MPLMKRQTAFKLNIRQILESEKDILDGKFKMLFVPNRNDKNKKEISRVNLIANVIEKFISDDRRFASLKLDDASGQIRIKTFGGECKKVENIEIGDTVRIVGWIRFYNAELYVIPEIIKKIAPEWLLARKLELEKEYRNGVSYEVSVKKISKSEEVRRPDSSKIYPPSLPSTEEKKEEIKIQEAPQKTIQEISQEPTLQEIPQKTSFGEEEKIRGVNEQITLFSKTPGSESSEEKSSKTLTQIEKIESPPKLVSTLRIIILDKIKDLSKESDSGAAIDELIMALDAPVQDINEIIEVLLEEGIIFEPKPGRLRVL